jgi:hypothetical protein
LTVNGAKLKYIKNKITMIKSKNLTPKESEFLLYTTPEGNIEIEVFLKDKTIWLTQKRIADLFGVGVSAINKHLINMFESGELNKDSVISKMEITAKDGKNYKTNLFLNDRMLP